MAKNTTKAKATKAEDRDRIELTEDDIAIRRTYEFEDGNISFDAEIKGFTFYGMTVVFYKKGKDTLAFVSEPSYKIGKGKKERWLKHYYLNLSDDAQELLISAVQEHLASDND